MNNIPILNIDAFGLITINPSCMKRQSDAIKEALKEKCEKAKECAAKCPHSKEAREGVEKVCDGKYTINCLHKDNEKCKATFTKAGISTPCGNADVGGNEMNLCPIPLIPKVSAERMGRVAQSFMKPYIAGDWLMVQRIPLARKILTQWKNAWAVSRRS